MLAENQNRLFEERIQKFDKKLYFDFEVKDYLVISIGEINKVNVFNVEKLSELESYYFIPILQCKWENKYNGTVWTNTDKEYLGIYEQRPYEVPQLVSHIDFVNKNRLSIGEEYKKGGWGISQVELTIEWENNNVPYISSVNALKMSGVNDFLIALSVASNCSNNQEAEAFIKFGYDHNAHCSYKEVILDIKQKLINIIEG